MNYASPPPPDVFCLEALRLEAVTCSVGFDDLLDLTLALNHPHFDTMIVVTDHHDRKTINVARKHGAICVETDLFKKNGRNFNKGAAINAGFDHFQYHGWRMHLDADIIVPDNFRRLLFNHTHLDPAAIYGADRVHVIGKETLHELRHSLHNEPQHAWSFLLGARHDQQIVERYVDTLRGYVPIGFFQLWNARTQKPYPWSLGSAAHDDVMFAAQWPATHRRHVPTAICYHLCAAPPAHRENWDGHRQQPRL
jgi:glycosyltransferase involved in cell wall biosynthesis